MTLRNVQFPKTQNVKVWTLNVGCMFHVFFLLLCFYSFNIGAVATIKRVLKFFFVVLCSAVLYCFFKTYNIRFQLGLFYIACSANGRTKKWTNEHFCCYKALGVLFLGLSNWGIRDCEVKMKYKTGLSAFLILPVSVYLYQDVSKVKGFEQLLYTIFFLYIQNK